MKATEAAGNTMGLIAMIVLPVLIGILIYQSKKLEAEE